MTHWVQPQMTRKRVQPRKQQQKMESQKREQREGALDGPVIPATALALGGTGVRLPLYLGRGPGGTGGVLKPSTEMRGGERERSAGGGVSGIGGPGAG